MKRTDWTTVPIAYETRSVCGCCGSPRVRTVRSVANGDGSRSKYVHCKACDHPRVIAVEISFPDSGNGEADGAIIGTSPTP